MRRDALFVESDRRAAGVLRRNVSELGLGGRVVVGAAGTVLARPAERAFDVLLADPPYAVTDDEVAGWLATALAGGWLADEAVVVVERARSRSAVPVAGRVRAGPRPPLRRHGPAHRPRSGLTRPCRCGSPHSE